MKTILHIAHAFFPDRSGTSERIFNSQPTSGFRHIILKPGRKNEVYSWGEFEVVATVLPYSKKSRRSTRLNALHMAHVAFGLIDDYDIHILYGHNPLLCSLATLKVINDRKYLQLVYEPHNLLYSHFLVRVKESRFRILQPILAAYHSNLIQIERKLFERADVIVSQTLSLGSCIQEIYSINPEKIVVAYNGIPKLNGIAKIKTNKFELPTKNKFVIYGGDLSKNNGLDIIVELVCSYPEISVVIAGTGTYFEELKRLSSIHDNLFFLGKLSKEEYLSVLNLSEALLILRESNLTNDNYLPLKLLDAMSLGKKVLTTDIRIMNEIRREYENIYFTQLDVESVAKAVKGCLEIREKDSLQLSNDARKKLSWSFSQNQIRNSLHKLG